MYNPALYLKIIASVLGIVVFALAGAGLALSRTSFFLAFVCLVAIIAITLYLIRLTNRTNRQIALFFDSIRNEDASQHFPLHTDAPFLRKIHAEMNRVIALLSENRSELEEKRLYYESILRVLTHEIRNSLTPIRSLSADLLTHSDSYAPEQLTEGLEVINGQAHNLNAFLDSYHRLTHLPEPEKKTVVLEELFHKLERLLAAEPGHQAIVYQTRGNPVVHADPNLITLAMINLIRNAMQAVAQQPTTVEQQPQAVAQQVKPLIRVEAFSHDGETRITITDNGPGIPLEQQSQIFLPFYSTKEGGSGIGLPLSQRIMRMHQGELSLSAKPGQNTIFTLRFPTKKG